MTATIPVDREILAAGLQVTLGQLAAAFAAHWPDGGMPPRAGHDGVWWTTCPACGHEYTPAAPLCPTLALVWPLLRRRGVAKVITTRGVVAVAVDPAVESVLHMVTMPIPQPAVAEAPRPADTAELFDASAYRRAKPARRRGRPA
jgi:hypothetical protein